MADSLLGRRCLTLDFPQVTDHDYLAASLKLHLFRRVPIEAYPAPKVNLLLAQAQANHLSYKGMREAGGYGKVVDA